MADAETGATSGANDDVEFALNALLDDPRLRISRVSPQERRLAGRLRWTLNATSNAHGCAASGIPQLFRDMAATPTEAACAVLDVLQRAMQEDKSMAMQVCASILPHIFQIIEALGERPEAAVECLLAARRVPTMRRFDIVEKSAITCLRQSNTILRLAEEAVSKAIAAGEPAAAVPDENFFAVVNGAIDGKPFHPDVFAVDQDSRVTLRGSNAPCAPCCAWWRGRRGLKPRCVVCHESIETPGQLVRCRCESATACRACVGSSADWHANCDDMCAKADTLLRRLEHAPGSCFVAFAPASSVLVPIPLAVALANPALPALWPRDLSVEDVELLIGFPALMASRYRASVADVAAAAAAAEAAAAAAAAALEHEEAEASAKQLRTTARAARRRKKLKGERANRRQAAVRIGTAVCSWWARIQQARAAARAAQRDAQHAILRVRIESRLMEEAARADALLEQRMLDAALVRKRQQARLAERASYRLAHLEHMTGRLASDCALLVVGD